MTYMNGRCCDNCAHATKFIDRVECNLIPGLRASIARNGIVAADDFCDQHDFIQRELPLVTT